VLVDIDPVTFNVRPSEVAAAITPRTRAILPVHLFGLCSDMDALNQIARRADVAVIEDAAQAIGARAGDRQAGSLGSAGCFSFYPSKNLSAFGDGGLVTTNDPALAKEIRLLRNHGAEPKYHHRRIGGNFRLDALQAAVLRVKAPHLAEWTDARRHNADRYRALFREYGLDDQVALPTEPEGYFHVYNQFVVRVPRRNELMAHLARRHVGTEVYYPVPFHRQECFADYPARREFPDADRAAAVALAIPIYGELTVEQQRHVVASIADFYGRTP
jgi:dTDP-4-amino-4,6-dideoxygalactose transaminase